MDDQNENPSCIQRVIKIEREDVSPKNDGGENIPCVSTVPVPAEDNRVYYFPTQAILPSSSSVPFPITARPPHFSNLRTMQKWAQKRKTIEAIAQGALQNASEPVLFEETISNANTKILVFDTTTKLEVHRSREEVREKLKANASLVALTKPNVTTEPGHFPTIRNCYSLTNDQPNSSGRQTTRTVGLATVTHCAVTATSKTPSMVNIYTHTPKSTLRTTSQPTTIVSRLPHQSPGTSDTLLKTTTKSGNDTSVTDSSNVSTDKNPVRQISPNTSTQQSSCPPNVCVVPFTSLRQDVSKTAVCLPNNVAKTTKELPSAIYVPKEIKVGTMELQLEECVNVNTICDKELTKWTAEDVAKFVRETDCSEYAEAFIDQEIDGKALTLLNQELLIQWMKLKLGPAMKLYNHILNLKHALNNTQ